jgi:RNA polymerase sigma-54 factor
MAEMFLRQELRLQQKLVMTQQLQLAIRLLHMSRMEMDQEIQKQLMENPCLEEETGEEPIDSRNDDKNEGMAPADSSSRDGDSAGTTQEFAAAADGESATSAEPAESQEREFNWDKFIDNYDTFRDGAGGPRKSDDETPSFENFVATPTTLYDHLTWQIRMSGLGELEVSVAGEIVGNIGDSGYFRSDDDDDLIAMIAETHGVPNDFVEHVLIQVQKFDPLGVGARNLAECLLIQAQHYYPEDEKLRVVIRDHMGNLERKKVKPILRAMKIDMVELAALVDRLGNLEPKPGRGYGGEHNPYVVPDVYVHKIEDDYIVILNDEGLTRLKVSGHYKTGLRGQDKNAKEFIKKRLGAAMWFIKSIEQRQQTIRKVSESIVAFQRDFLEQGPEYLKPLVLRDVAEDIGMHESTVSRVTSNKYMHTPQGILPLKYFFNSRIECDGLGDLASEAVKKKIARYIQGENQKKPLSDQAIADMLANDEGVRIARRTVAKYREQMGLGSSSQRKKIF